MKLYIDRAKGSWLYDDKGNRYLDACAGTFNVVLGHGHKRVLAAVRSQMNKLIHYSSSWASHEVERLCEELTAIAPRNIDSCFCKATGGSTANDIAIRMMAKSNGKKKVIMMEGGHHGNTIFLSNDNSVFGLQNKIYAPMPQFKYPLSKNETNNLWEESAGGVETLLKKHQREAACMIIEPIQGRGGNLVPPKRFFKIISEAARAFEVPIIADEVQTGVGRTGYFFASDAFGFKPDAIVLAKGLTGCGFPLGAVLYNSEYGKLQSCSDGFTFGSNMLSVVAANETIAIVNESAFLANIRENGVRLKKEIDGLKASSPAIAEVRGIGLFMGIKIINERADNLDTFVDDLLARKVIVRAGTGIVKIRPPLNISLEEMDFLMAALKGAFNGDR